MRLLGCGSIPLLRDDVMIQPARSANFRLCQGDGEYFAATLAVVISPIGQSQLSYVVVRICRLLFRPYLAIIAFQ